MAQIKISAAPDVQSTIYGNFRGVDFSVDPSLVDRRRSPCGTNMISDDGGNPVKRLGWRILQDFGSGKINGIFRAKIKGNDILVVHAGTKLFRVVDGESTELMSGISDTVSTGFTAISTLKGEEELLFDSAEEDYNYPKTFTIPAGSYYVELGGGKGAGIRFWNYTDQAYVSRAGSPGGKIAFYVNREEETSVRIEKIRNGSETLRASFHIYLGEVLYAAVGGAGDCGGGDQQLWHYYLSAKAGGFGGGKTGGDSNGGLGGTQDSGGDGEYKGAVAGEDETYIPGEDGQAYPVSTGGGTNSLEELGPESMGAGGCGYCGGGSGGYYWNKSEYGYKKSYGAGGGGSSYVVESDDINLIENSQGTNDGPAYIKLLKKDDPSGAWKDILYILTGREYLYFDGEKADVVEGYIPTTIISRRPDGGGESYENVNLIQPKRTESFLGDAESKTYHLSSKNLDDEEVLVRIANIDGGWDEMTEGNGFTVDRSAGTVTFEKANAPVISGQDNVQITYSKTVPGYSRRIKRCTICALYGVGGDNRIFVSGNPDLPNYDWWSDIYDPTYFPDLNYAVVGLSTTAIMGYQKVGSALAVIKEDNAQDTTVFLRTGSINAEGEAVFSLAPGIAGIGAISKRSFSSLGDEPLFLSNRGIHAMASTLLTSERIMRNRSYFVDRQLTREPHLENAVSCEWRGYYLLFINQNVYILDGRHKAGDSRGNTDFLYECYFWENVPAICVLSTGTELYFGTLAGQLCKLNTDIENMTAYQDGGVLGEGGYCTGGEAIDACWFTMNDDDGCVQFFKTLQKKGSLGVFAPYDRSSCDVYFIVDSNPKEKIYVKYEELDLFNWANIDFSRFTFNSNEGPREVYFYKKKKKYKRLQIGLRNNAINEGFGVNQIVKSYVIGNYSKNREV